MAYARGMKCRGGPEQARTTARGTGPGRARTGPSAGLVGLVIASLLAGGCRDAEPTPAPATATAPVVTLLDPGAEPRRPLRYRLVPGAQETLTMRTEMAIATRADGGDAAPAVEYPPVVMTLRLRVAEAGSAPDRARYEFALEAVEVEDAPGVAPEVVDAMRRHFDEIEGMTGSADVDARGFNWNARVERPRGRAGHATPALGQVLDSTAQGMERMSAPLPEEPVGQGARWELRQTIEQNGVTLEQRTLFELIELDGQRGVLATQITQRAGRQPMAVAGAPAGAAELLSLESTGTGRLHFDLDRLGPRSTLTLRSDYGVRVTAGEQPQTITTRIDMRVEIAGQ